jgi:hypothetical protein
MVVIGRVLVVMTIGKMVLRSEINSNINMAKNNNHKGKKS